jgi:hypothetical protein
MLDLSKYSISSNVHQSLLAQKSYDFVFPLGQQCNCAINLSANLLRQYAGPFDWVFGANFEERIAIILNDFQGYFEKDKLEFVKGTIYRPNKLFYVNKENGIRFVHDCLESENPLSLSDVYPSIKEKYDRRINRWLNIFKDRNLNVLCVYIQSTITKISNEQIISLHDKLRQKFKANVDMLFIRHELSFRMDELYLEALSQNIFIASLNNSSNKVYGNERMLSLLLDNVNTKSIIALKNASYANSLFIYGSGVIGKNIAEKLVRRNIGFNGFIVSDDQNILYNLCKVFHLKELPIPYPQATIIFGLNSENRKIVKKYLEKNGIKFGSEIRFADKLFD